MKIIGRIVTVIVLLVIGYLVCYLGWGPQIIDYLKGLFSK